MAAVKSINSPDNQVYKNLIKLGQKKNRDRDGLYIIEGENLIEEAIKNGIEIQSVFIREDYPEERLPEAAAAQAASEVQIFSLKRQLFNKASDTETPQGILAVCRKPAVSEAAFFEEAERHDGQIASDVPDQRFIVLDRLQDPGNLGTILRTADAAGIRRIVVVKGTADLFSPKTVRAAAGSLFRVRLFFTPDGQSAIDAMKKRGIRILCTSPHAGKMYFEENLKDRIALVIGNEANGASETFLENSDSLINIPMNGSIESLNAAVSAAVVMYESVRQKIIQEA